MMIYDFDTVISRKGSGCFKYDALSMMYGVEDLLPLWVADMDFAIAPEIQEAIYSRTCHPIYGYNFRGREFSEAVCMWQQSRFGWQIQPEWQIAHLGVMPALAMAILALTEPGDGILIQTPVYPPFHSTALDHQRQLITSPLIMSEGCYQIDFDDLDRKLSQAKMFILCNPHNPVGRVFTQAELLQIGALCRKHKVMVFNDEIHADIVYSPHRHISFASLEDFADFTITAISPAKSFNLAGLATAVLIVSNEVLRASLTRMNFALHTYMGNSIGNVALVAAYTKGGAWLDALILYLQANRDYLAECISEQLSHVRFHKVEGTYLAWLEFFGIDYQELERIMVQEAGLALNSGHTFGQEGRGFMRINFACPRSILIEAMNRLKQIEVFR